MTLRRTVIVLAKTPVAGRVKTRLCPPCSERESAVLAAAALADTLDTVRRVPDVRRIVALDGDPGDWIPEEFDVVAQPPGRLDERIAAALAATPGPTVLIGMDTPQVRAADLEHALSILVRGLDAVVGPAIDGGYWLLGLRVPQPDVVLGIPMSVGDTGAAQTARLEAHGLTYALLRELRDVDHFGDALAVANEAPTSRFAHAVRAMQPRLAATLR